MPTRSNRCDRLTAGTRSPCTGRSTEVIVASSPNAAGAVSAAAATAARRARAQRIPGQGDPGVVRGQGRDPSVHDILTRVSSRFLRAFLLAVAAASVFAVAGLGANADQQPRVLAVHMAADINPVTQEYLDGE